GRVVVSGFMYGVDLAAAQIALKNGGQTIAVLGFGFDHCFPSSQKKIMQEFLERGAIFLSEFAPETLAKASNFVTRNRIVAGLSKATLVIEAAKRSGSHITANYANDYGRIVMAVPGPITNPFSEGTKVLISQGATLVNNASDVLKGIADDYHFQLCDSVKNEQEETDKSKTLLEKLTFYPELTFDDLMKNNNFIESELNQLLFDLELQGKIIKKWGKYCLVS
ncbi:MAG: protecting protein DprA protein, partial [Candidatus Pacebacteria bacterium GW2011_GWF1_36_5]